LASVSIRAMHLSVELNAGLGLVIGGQVDLAVELVLPVGEAAAVLELALAPQLPVPAHLRLELYAVGSNEVSALRLALEVALGLLDCGFEELLLRWVLVFLAVVG